MLSAFGEHLMTSLHSDVTKMQRSFSHEISKLESNFQCITNLVQIVARGIQRQWNEPQKSEYTS